MKLQLQKNNSRKGKSKKNLQNFCKGAYCSSMQSEATDWKSRRIRERKQQTLPYTSLSQLLHLTCLMPTYKFVLQLTESDENCFFCAHCPSLLHGTRIHIKVKEVLGFCCLQIRVCFQSRLKALNTCKCFEYLVKYRVKVCTSL